MQLAAQAKKLTWHAIETFLTNSRHYHTFRHKLQPTLIGNFRSW